MWYHIEEYHRIDRIESVVHRLDPVYSRYHPVEEFVECILCILAVDLFRIELLRSRFSFIQYHNGPDASIRGDAEEIGIWRHDILLSNAEI